MSRMACSCLRQQNTCYGIFLLGSFKVLIPCGLYKQWQCQK
ncbi:hypothetical protein SAMN04487941_0106 [Pontibacter akesuensis]|uniref:Uncharacterized protein n=1 Tax=Pontibacter akesuensis TaxID=388950 RepID=A0A1I7KY61_9BACT|nr:hypothetical protein SAMN04487941_0106 [Pontibacter akesuensis]